MSILDSDQRIVYTAHPGIGPAFCYTVFFSFLGGGLELTGVFILFVSQPLVCLIGSYEYNTFPFSYLFGALALRQRYRHKTHKGHRSLGWLGKVLYGLGQHADTRDITKSAMLYPPRLSGRGKAKLIRGDMGLMVVAALEAMPREGHDDDEHTIRHAQRQDRQSRQTDRQTLTGSTRQEGLLACRKQIMRAYLQT